MLEVWKKQFALERLYMEHENPAVFVSSQWQRKPGPSLYYLIYRFLIAIFFLMSLTFSIADLRHMEQSAGDRAKWLIYLTNWGFTMCTVQAVLCTCMLFHHLLTERTGASESLDAEQSKALKLYKVYWVINTIATDVSFGITIIYWSLIYDEKKMPLDEMNIIVHVFNSLLMLIDLFVVAHPVEILHFIWPVFFGVCYVFFSIIYYVAGGTSKEGAIYIYQILDWSKPQMTIVVCILVTLFIVALHFLAYGSYRLRKYIHASLQANPEEKEPDDKKAYNNPAVSGDIV